MAAKYCIECGHALETREVDGTPRRACPNCDYVHWGDYSLGVGALVMRDDGFLLVRRAQDPGRGLWTNPGGYTEQFELLDDTVVREVQEETGVLAEVEGIVALRDAPRTVHNLYLVYAMRYISGEPHPDGIEVDAAGFYTPLQMENMQVAALTRWIVKVGLRYQEANLKKEAGLVRDEEVDSSLQSYGLFRIR